MQVWRWRERFLLSLAAGRWPLAAGEAVGRFPEAQAFGTALLVGTIRSATSSESARFLVASAQTENTCPCLVVLIHPHSYQIST